MLLRFFALCLSGEPRISISNISPRFNGFSAALFHQAAPGLPGEKTAEAAGLPPQSVRSVSYSIAARYSWIGSSQALPVSSAVMPARIVSPLVASMGATGSEKEMLSSQITFFANA